MAKRFAILAATACLFGILSGTPSVAPTAGADQLGNGYNVTCTASGSNASCQVSGCPRVKDDLAGDVIHTRFNSQPEQEIGKGCNNTANVTTGLTDSTVDAAAGFTFSVQGCRKHMSSSDDCGAWSVYKYVPPAPAPAAKQNPVKCTGGPDAGKTLPPGSTCAVAPVQAAPVKCPAGSVTDTVPAGQQCGAPTNAAAVNISRNGLNARVAITNNSSLPAKCSYTAKKTNGLLGPQEVDRTIDVGAKSTNSITDMLWPPLGVSYNAVVNCTVTYNGKQTSIGQNSQNVSG